VNRRIIDEIAHDTDYWRACRCVERSRISLLSEDEQRHYNSTAQSLADKIVGTSPTATAKTRRLAQSSTTARVSAINGTTTAALASPPDRRAVACRPARLDHALRSVGDGRSPKGWRAGTRCGPARGRGSWYDVAHGAAGTRNYGMVQQDGPSAKMDGGECHPRWKASGYGSFMVFDVPTRNRFPRLRTHTRGAQRCDEALH
jgi:hypothetical protein